MRPESTNSISLQRQNRAGVRSAARLTPLPRNGRKGSVCRALTAGLLLATSQPVLAGTSTTTEILQDHPDPSLVGQGIVVFTELNADGGSPTGTITVSDGTDSCTATLPQMFCLYQPQSPGSKSLTATYSGDSNFDPSVSISITHEVVLETLPERVSIPDEWEQFGSVFDDPIGTSRRSAISSDGRFVAFESSAPNLVPEDTNGERDIFVFDRRTRFIERVSVDSMGAEASDESQRPAISSNGRFVVFVSRAPDLVPADTNGTSDVFLHDRQNGVTERISVDPAGAEANDASSVPSISSDGRFVAFASNATNLVPGDTNGTSDIFLRDRQSGMTERVDLDDSANQSNGGSGRSSISADGRFIAFSSGASNLVSGDTNGASDIFVRDRDMGTTERVALDSSGTEANDDSFRPKISSNGRFVVFDSEASNLVANDNNGLFDVFLHDRQTGLTDRVSVDSAGGEGNDSSNRPAISSDGRFVAFVSDASNLVAEDNNGEFDVFVHDRASGTTERASVASDGDEGMNGFTGFTSISGDGRLLVFNSEAQNFSPNDQQSSEDIFIRDRQTETTERVSIAPVGTQANEQSFRASSSSGGRFIAFESRATNLVSGDTNGETDIFVHDRQAGTTERVSVASSGTEGDGGSFDPSISADGRFVAFTSRATNLVSGDTNAEFDIFVHDRQAGTTERVSVASRGHRGR